MNLGELYKQAKEESLKRPTPTASSGKAEKIKKAVVDLAKQVNERELLASAAYQAVKKALEPQGIKIERAYFMQVMKKAFKLEKKDGRIFIKIQ